MKKNIIKLFLPLMAMSLNSCGNDLPKEISQDAWNDNRQSVTLSTGIKMSYVEMGDPKGAPIILQHGMTDNSRSWSLAAPYFAKAGYHIYMPDLRAHGHSEVGNGGYNTTFTYAIDLNAFCEAKKISNAIVVGHSLGSYTMQTFWLLYPQRCAKVVLISSLPLLGLQDSTQIKALVDALPEDGHMSDTFMDYWYDCSADPVEDGIKGEVFDKFLANMKKEAQALGKQNWKNIIYGVDGSHFGNPVGSQYTKYSQFDKSKKCLILHGETDAMAKGEKFGVTYQQDLINYLSNDEKNNVSYKEYKGVGHNIHFVQPKACATDIISWLETGKVAS